MSNKLLNEVVAVDKYCRWRDDLGRRETWHEAVDRYFGYLINRFNLGELPVEAQKALHDARTLMYNKEIFGSMRALWSAGPALDRDDVCAYNCAYMPTKSFQDFQCAMYILSCGTGNGFSVEGKYVYQLPDLPKHLDYSGVIVVEDSKEGWADALRQFLDSVFSGVVPVVDASKVRPKGARLKTFGGRASGPEPFIRLIDFITKTVEKEMKEGHTKLTRVSAHKIHCMIADVIVCGGVRRSAEISLSDLEDDQMATVKSGNWYDKELFLSNSNNSAVYEQKPSMSTFLKEWSSLYNSFSGERGICNRQAMKTIARAAGRDDSYDFGTNPCSEIILRPYQFCNLSTIVVRENDTPVTLIKKITAATILGTLQSAMTNFTYFEKIGATEWKKNCEEERLLGVSMTGIFSNNLMNGGHGPEELQKILSALKSVAKTVNAEWAEYVDINPSKSITCIKPEGTTSSVAGCSSGIHPEYAPYFIRRVQFSKNEPITQFLMDQKVPWETIFGKPDMVVFEFPCKGQGVTADQVDAIGQLNLWLAYQLWYCDHKPSITVYYRDNEFMRVGDWVWNHWDLVSGVAFLPRDDNVYTQTPFEKISVEKYDELMAKMPKEINWSLLPFYEEEDNTTGSQEFACVGDSCKI
jgi:ribonucleoside-diphosphate reductase alpha chain